MTGDYKFDTLSLHAGFTPDERHGSAAVPIHQTTSYVFKDSEHAAALYNLEIGGHLYSRISNPTVAVLEQRVAALDEGIGAVATSSGMAALFVTVLALCSAGDHIVSSSQMYGANINLFQHTLSRYGITTTFVAPNDPEAFAEAIQPNTKMVFGEVIGNPGLDIMDITRVGKIANDAGVPLVIDATFNTPYLLKPLKNGANIVIHSLTKWMGGHGVALGGIVVDGGNFDWGQNDRFPTLTESHFGFQGVNTKKMLDFLSSHESISWIKHPTLPEHPDYEVAKRLMPKGAGSVIACGLKGGREAGQSFIESVQVASHLANVGDAKTLVIHPGSTTQSHLSPEAMKAAGLTDDMLRISVGLEDFDDLKSDFEQALKRASKARS